MANRKISELSSAGTLTGTELVEVVKSGANVQTTTQDIANLGGGGGGDLSESDIDTVAKLNAIITDGDFATVVQLATKADSQVSVRDISASNHTIDSTDLTAINNGANYVIEGDATYTVTIPLYASVAIPYTPKRSIIGLRGFTTVAGAGGVTVTGTNGTLAISSGHTAYIEPTGLNTWMLYNGSSSPSASDTAAGIVELATSAETVTGTDTVRATTPAGVKAAIDALIGSAPGALNTLDELAAALGDDANFAATVTTELAAKASLTGVETLTNKRITPRVQSVTSSATVTPNADSYDAVKITAQAADLTLANPSGTPTDMQAMVIRIKDNGIARSITYGSQYRAIGITLPASTIASKTIYEGLVWNANDSKWDVIGCSVEA